MCYRDAKAKKRKHHKDERKDKKRKGKEKKERKKDKKKKRKHEKKEKTQPQVATANTGDDDEDEWVEKTPPRLDNPPTTADEDLGDWIVKTPPRGTEIEQGEPAKPEVIEDSLVPTQKLQRESWMLRAPKKLIPDATKAIEKNSIVENVVR